MYINSRYTACIAVDIQYTTYTGLAAEKTPPPLPQGGEPSGWGGRGVGVPAHIYSRIRDGYMTILIAICNMMSLHHPRISALDLAAALRSAKATVYLRVSPIWRWISW